MPSLMCKKKLQDTETNLSSQVKHQAKDANTTPKTQHHQVQARSFFFSDWLMSKIQVHKRVICFVASYSIDVGPWVNSEVLVSSHQRDLLVSANGTITRLFMDVPEWETSLK